MGIIEVKESNPVVEIVFFSFLKFTAYCDFWSAYKFEQNR